MHIRQISIMHLSNNKTYKLFAIKNNIMIRPHALQASSISWNPIRDGDKIIVSSAILHT